MKIFKRASVMMFCVALIVTIAMPFELVASNTVEQGKKEVGPPAFNDTLNTAYRYGVSGNFKRSIALFEQLMKAHPKEWIVYDFYTQILELQDNFTAAGVVFQKALQNMGPERKSEIEARIKNIQSAEAFAQGMKEAPSWSEAKVFGGQEFVIQTNIPASYYQPLVAHLKDILHKERNLLAEIFGPPGAAFTYLKIFVFGRFDEYKSYIDERNKRYKDFGQNPITGYGKAIYVPNENAIVIHFNGSCDWSNVAHEMAHYLIHDLYIKAPSRFVAEGFAQYLSYKVEKENAKAELLSNIEFIKWVYEQGKFEYAMDLFVHWHTYESTISAKVFQDEQRLFYLMSWIWTCLFMDGQAPEFQGVFKQYLKYESEREFNTMDSSSAYFSKNLSKKQIEELDQRWGKFITEIDYEKI